MAEHRVSRPSDVVSEGDRVTVKIISLDPAARRMGLSLREARQELEARSAAEAAAAYDGNQSAATIGEMVDNLGELLKTRPARGEGRSG